MTNAGQFDVEAYERDVTAALDREVAAIIAQGNDFQQRMYWFASSGQVPPQLFLTHADGLMRWIEHVRQHRPAAEWLMKHNRPAITQRLAAIIDDLSKAVPRYHAMAGQQSASWSNMVNATVAADREINNSRASSNADDLAAHAARSARLRNLL